MAERDTINCEVWQVTFPEWERLKPEIRENFANVLQGWSEFVGPPRSRRGFAGVRRVKDVIVGFYLQEDLRTGLEGDNPSNLRQSQDANFEKLFFAIVLDVGHVVIQRTSLFDYVSMNYTSMRGTFIETLADAFQLAGLPITRVEIAKFYKKREQSEMREIFANNITTRVEISELKGRQVPENVQLSNPDPSEEVLLKRIFNRDYERIESEAVQAATGQDLRRTKTAKAAVGAGHVDKLEIQDSNGRIDTIYVEQDEKLKVPINDGKQIITDVEAGEFIEVYERRIRFPASRIQTSDLKGALGPLFDQKDSSNG